MKRARNLGGGEHSGGGGGGGSGGSGGSLRESFQQEDSYFTGYNDYKVHRKMLDDNVRVEAYAKAIEDNSERFKGKVVMDVGAGSGILSLLAARAGARKVFAVEASSMARTIKLAALENGFGGIISVLHGRVEEVDLPDGFEKVDVIVSEWMAIFLVQEGMLESVLFARDKWLAKDTGSIFPCRGSIFVQPADMHDDRARELSFWDNVHGFRFGVLQQRAAEAQTAGPHRKTVRAEQIVASPLLLADFDLNAMNASSLVEIRKEGIQFECAKPFCSLCFWWTTTFPEPTRTDTAAEHVGKSIVLSTAPDAPPTHWEQGVIHLPGLIGPADGSSFKSPLLKVVMKRSISNQRNYDITIDSM